MTSKEQLKQQNRPKPRIPISSIISLFLLVGCLLFAVACSVDSGEVSAEITEVEHIADSDIRIQIKGTNDNEFCTYKNVDVEIQALVESDNQQILTFNKEYSLGTIKTERSKTKDFVLNVSPDTIKTILSVEIIDVDWDDRCRNAADL